MPKTLRGSFEQALRPPPSVVKGVQACRLPGGFFFPFLFFACFFFRNVPMFLLASLSCRRVMRDRDSAT
jgi:hypothetical protein